MMEASSSQWHPTSEENLSTGSDSNMLPVTSEFSNVRRFAVPSKVKRNTAIGIVTATVLIVCGTVFQYAHSSSSNNLAGVGESPTLRHDVPHHTKGYVVVDDLFDQKTANAPTDETQFQSDQPRALPRLQYEDASNRSRNGRNDALSSQRTNTTEVSTSRTKRRKSTKRNHGPRQLPVDAQDKHPLSLLYQMKLVHGKHGSYTNYTKCEDEIDDKMIFKGWKAVLSINATLANIDPAINHFTGYGKKQVDARTEAARRALQAVYPGQLTYVNNDLSEIRDFCG